MAAALAAVTLRRDVKEVEVKVEREGQDGRRILETEMRRQKVAQPLVRATVQWSDILDAEFAHFWPETVVHDRWVTTFNNRRAPTQRTELREEEMEEEVVEAEAEVVAVPEPVKNEAGKVVL